MNINRIRFGILVILMSVVLAACTSSAQQVSPTAPVVPSTAPTQMNLPLTTESSTAPSQGSQGTPAQTTGVPITGNEVTFVVVPDKSEARYRVREQLANVSLPSDAVGKTSTISGSIVVQPDGKIVSSASKITVDLSTLQSDRSQRDNFVRRNILQTDQYPQAVFVPSSVTGLPAALPSSGDVAFQVSGDLTIRNVTKPVTWNVTGKVQNGTATGTATTSFKFEDFNLDQPRVPIVLSVVDNITLEVDITLQQSTP